MQIFLAAADEKLRDAFVASTGDLPDVNVHLGSILDLACDAIVSPANSFGFMDGGIDAQYTAHFGTHVQDRVRRNILMDHHGELLVGAATIVETDDAKAPYLIAAPTMRVPMLLGSETINPYLATRAAILLARAGRFTDGSAKGRPISDKVRRIAFPGMGTGVGSVPADIAAHQMASAIRLHRNSPHRLPGSWAEASEDHQFLYTDKPVRLQR